MATAFFCGAKEDFEQKTAGLEPMRRVVETYISAQSSLTGYCAGCREISTFEIGKSPHANAWINLREVINCPACRLNGRQRLALSLIDDVYRDLSPQRAHVFERVTPLYAMLGRRGYPISGSEYIGDGVASGTRHKRGPLEIEHQDLHALSYADGALDFVCHFDVLEHVADYRRALGECSRVLRPGGVLLFTVPFFGAAETQIRSEVIDGKLVHHHPPGYHANPVSAEGSLVFFLPGWTILDDLRQLGFETAEIGLSYDAFQGIVSDNNPYPTSRMWPVFFRARRGAG